ncbi:MAG: VacB/RNase II family 3'-5' exoribonuclease [Parachlamydiales bacterium]|nr:VacB/RNase II family 3'-5' exoribonuclease [Parachlamydiales bacterium]
MKKKIFTGTFRKNPKGFGFVMVTEKDVEDIFIPKNGIGLAIDGDLVEVTIKNITQKGLDGTITEILEREKKYLYGIIIKKLKKNSYLAYSPTIGKNDQILLKSLKTLKHGDRIIMKVTKWPDKKEAEIFAELHKFLSHISDPSKDIDAAIAEFDIRKDFSKKILNEIKNFKITEKDFENRKDYTNLDCITVDPATAKDYDDSVSLQKDNNGNFHLGVHITDVAHFVRPNTALDEEAFKRGNSVYFPNVCIPMLPQKLSNDLCSLIPNEIRLTVSVMMVFDKNGNLKSYDINRSFIKSIKRFSYEEALKLIDSKKENDKLRNILLDMLDLMKLLKEKRFERGSIDFALADTQIIVDQRGNPIEIKVVKYDETHQMIEEFMLKANEIVAKHLSQKGKTLIFRVHEEPAYENFEDFYDLARSLGFKLKAKPTHLDIQKLFLEAKNTPHIERLSINFIRNLKLALYSEDNIGHYGLALEHYTHFTSPIRRYSDLVIHRLLFNEEDKDQKDKLAEIAKYLSEKERHSFKAESSVILLKKYRLLNKILKVRPKKRFSATITKVKPYFLVFELDDFSIEGSLHVSNLQDDYYEYNENTLRLIGQNTNTQYYVSKKITVKILHLDLILLLADYQIDTKRK